MWSKWLELFRKPAMWEKRINHWGIFVLLTLSEKVIFQEIWEKDTFLTKFGHFYPFKRCVNNLKYLEILILVELQRICNNHEYHTLFTLTTTPKGRDRTKRFGIANYKLFSICSESNTILLQFFHEPYITHMFQKRIIRFLKLTKLRRK